MNSEKYTMQKEINAEMQNEKMPKNVKTPMRSISSSSRTIKKTPIRTTIGSTTSNSVYYTPVKPSNKSTIMLDMNSSNKKSIGRPKKLIPVDTNKETKVEKTKPISTPTNTKLGRIKIQLTPKSTKINTMNRTSEKKSVGRLKKDSSSSNSNDVNEPKNETSNKVILATPKSSNSSSAKYLNFKNMTPASVKKSIGRLKKDVSYKNVMKENTTNINNTPNIKTEACPQESSEINNAKSDIDNKQQPRKRTKSSLPSSNKSTTDVFYDIDSAIRPPKTLRRQTILPNTEYVPENNEIDEDISQTPNARKSRGRPKKEKNEINIKSTSLENEDDTDITVSTKANQSQNKANEINYEGLLLNKSTSVSQTSIDDTPNKKTRGRPKKESSVSNSKSASLENEYEADIINSIKTNQSHENDTENQINNKDMDMEPPKTPTRQILFPNTKYVSENNEIDENISQTPNARKSRGRPKKENNQINIKPTSLENEEDADRALSTKTNQSHKHDKTNGINTEASFLNKSSSDSQTSTDGTPTKNVRGRAKKEISQINSKSASLESDDHVVNVDTPLNRKSRSRPKKEDSQMIVSSSDEENAKNTKRKQSDKDKNADHINTETLSSAKISDDENNGSKISSSNEINPPTTGILINNNQLISNTPNKKTPARPKKNLRIESDTIDVKSKHLLNNFKQSEITTLKQSSDNVKHDIDSPKSRGRPKGNNLFTESQIAYPDTGNEDFNMLNENDPIVERETNNQTDLGNTSIKRGRPKKSSQISEEPSTAKSIEFNTLNSSTNIILNTSSDLNVESVPNKKGRGRPKKEKKSESLDDNDEDGENMSNIDNINANQSLNVESDDINSNNNIKNSLPLKSNETPNTKSRGRPKKEKKFESLDDNDEDDVDMNNVDNINANQSLNVESDDINSNNNIKNSLPLKSNETPNTKSRGRPKKEKKFESLDDNDADDVDMNNVDNSNANQSLNVQSDDINTNNNITNNSLKVNSNETPTRKARGRPKKEKKSDSLDDNDKDNEDMNNIDNSNANQSLNVYSDDIGIDNNSKNSVPINSIEIPSRKSRGRPKKEKKSDSLDDTDRNDEDMKNIDNSNANQSLNVQSDDINTNNITNNSLKVDSNETPTRKARGRPKKEKKSDSLDDNDKDNEDMNNIDNSNANQSLNVYSDDIGIDNNSKNSVPINSIEIPSRKSRGRPKKEKKSDSLDDNDGDDEDMNNIDNSNANQSLIVQSDDIGIDNNIKNSLSLNSNEIPNKKSRGHLRKIDIQSSIAKSDSLDTDNNNTETKQTKRTKTTERSTSINESTDHDKVQDDTPNRKQRGRPRKDATPLQKKVDDELLNVDNKTSKLGRHKKRYPIVTNYMQPITSKAIFNPVDTLIENNKKLCTELNNPRSHPSKNSKNTSINGDLMVHKSDNLLQFSAEPFLSKFSSHQIRHSNLLTSTPRINSETENNNESDSEKSPEQENLLADNNVSDEQDDLSTTAATSTTESRIKNQRNSLGHSKKCNSQTIDIEMAIEADYDSLKIPTRVDNSSQTDITLEDIMYTKEDIKTGIAKNVCVTDKNANESEVFCTVGNLMESESEDDVFYDVNPTNQDQTLAVETKNQTELSVTKLNESEPDQSIEIIDQKTGRMENIEDKDSSAVYEQDKENKTITTSFNEENNESIEAVESTIDNINISSLRDQSHSVSNDETVSSTEDNVKNETVNRTFECIDLSEDTIKDTSISHNLKIVEKNMSIQKEASAELSEACIDLTDSLIIDNVKQHESRIDLVTPKLSASLNENEESIRDDNISIDVTRTLSSNSPVESIIGKQKSFNNLPILLNDNITNTHISSTPIHPINFKVASEQFKQIKPLNNFLEPSLPNTSILKSSRKRSFSVDTGIKNRVTFYSPLNTEISTIEIDEQMNKSQLTGGGGDKKCAKSVSKPGRKRSLSMNDQLIAGKTNSNLKHKPTSKVKLINFKEIHNSYFEKLESIDEYLQRKNERSKKLGITGTSSIIDVKVTGTVRPIVNKITAGSSTLNTHSTLSAPKLPPVEKSLKEKNKVDLRKEKNKLLFKGRLMKPDNNLNKRNEILKGVRTNRRFELQMNFRRNN